MAPGALGAPFAGRLLALFALLIVAATVVLFRFKDPPGDSRYVVGAAQHGMTSGPRRERLQ